MTAAFTIRQLQSISTVRKLKVNEVILIEYLAAIDIDSVKMIRCNTLREVRYEIFYKYTNELAHHVMAFLSLLRFRILRSVC